MRKLLAVWVLLSLIYFSPVTNAAKSDANAAGLAQPQSPYQNSGYQPYTNDQLDNLLAPIALYPDPLLAQVLLATTFPDQIQDAAQWVPVNDPSGIDSQNWDVSVKAVAHYPSVLSMLNGMLDWTTAVGQAYVYQSTDVMTSVQRLRNLALSQGNLVSTPQQQVIVNGGYIQIDPAQSQVIYVPVYDPGVIYERRVYSPGVGFGGFFNFGSGFAIGAWLNYDLDWGSRRVVYNGWQSSDSGWRQRSRPYVQINNVYVNNRYVNVNVNRTVVNRHVDYNNVNRFNSVHHDVNYNNRARFESDRGGNQPPPRGGGQPGARPGNNRTFNPGARNQPPAGAAQPAAPPNDRGIRNQPQPGQPNRTFNRPGATTQPTPQPNERTFNPAGRNQPAGRPEQPAASAPPQPNKFNPAARNQPPAGRPEQPARPAPPVPAPPARPAPQPPPVRASEGKSNGQQQQQGQQGQRGGKNDSRDGGKDNRQ